MNLVVLTLALNLHRTSTTATCTTTRTTDAQLFLVLFTYKISCSRFTAFGFSGFCHFTKFRVRVVPTKGLVHTFPFLFENGVFFSPVWPSGENGHIFPKRSPEWGFLKMLASLLFMDGQKGKFWKTMMS